MDQLSSNLWTSRNSSQMEDLSFKISTWPFIRGRNASSPNYRFRIIESYSFQPQMLIIVILYNNYVILQLLSSLNHRAKIGVLGINGSGKSSLLKIIAGL